MLFEAAVAHGHISLTGKSDEEVRRDFQQLVVRASKAEFIPMGMDHTESLRGLASRLESEGQVEVAVVLMATWVEHIINLLVVTVVERRGLGSAIGQQVVREVALPAKLTWLLKLLGLPAIPTKHLAVLRQLSDKRNQYVHYKWPVSHIDELSANPKEFVDLLARSKPALRYLAGYRTRALLQGGKARISKLIQAKRKTPNPSLKRRPATAGELGRATALVYSRPHGQARPPLRAA